MPKLTEILGEAYSQIPKEIKSKYRDMDLVDSSNYIIREKYNSLKTDIENELNIANKTIEELKKNNKGNEELKNRIDQYEKDYKKLKRDSEKEIGEMQFNYALEKALNKSGAKNSKAIKALINTEKIKLEGESIIGLDEQLKNLKASDPYLFAENKIITPKPGDGISTPGGSSLAVKIAKKRNKQVQNSYENMWK
ncbi:phage scaffolding protein [Clostridium sp. JS66]|uniref:phage scaffolding protein n=1 Tax=Clostridium sp. JS66 TaxID=3064705 RepID=UPI00298D8AC7|nr:phage scaffolding protein [Clostridium sp. JS66]WPC40630.1 phage scaffolding protein [Clostridium sp. JS66]